jgi:hypothetical protein
VEFDSSSVSKELNEEEEMGQCRFSGGREGGMTALRFGSSCTEEGGNRQCTARWHSWRGGGADGSQRWEPMERRKWAESQGGCSMNSFFFLNFKQDFRFKNQRFEILLN